MKRSPLLLFAIIYFLLASPKIVNAQISDWQKGITIRLNNQSVTEVDNSLNTLKNTNANFVVITPGYITDNKYSANVDRKAGTPSDTILVYTITKAHSLGLKVMLKPHLDLKTGLWRANLDPSDKETFFANYNSMILHNAKIAEQTKVEMFSVGCELVLLTTNKDNENYWNTIISNVRKTYSGKLTYSANAGTGSVDESKLPFWEKLDYLGLDMYMSLSDNNNPTLDSLLNSWKRIDSEYVYPFKLKYPTKPLIFTEMGFRSMDGASTMPWDYQINKPVDLNEQYLMYQSFFNYWKNVDYFKGVNIWDWQVKANAGGPTNNDYTPQNKPSEALITQMFSSVIVPTPISTVIPTPSPKASITPSVTPTIISPLPPVVTSNLVVNITPVVYKLSELKVNNLVYIDRPYVITEYPNLIDKLLMIRTRNVEKNNISQNQVTFNLSKDAYVYVARDIRIKETPNWLVTFTKTNFQIKTSDTIFYIYKKQFDEGKVELGGNVISSAQQNISNYFVLLSQNDLLNSTPTPSVTPSPIQPTVMHTLSLSLIPSITPRVDAENYLNKSIDIVEPDNGTLLSGEKKIKIKIDGLNLDLYTALVSINGNEFVMSDSLDSLYKQLKIDYDTLNLNDKSTTLNFYAKDLKGTIFATKTISIPF